MASPPFVINPSAITAAPPSSASSSLAASSGIVSLNIGGTLFQTTLQTLSARGPNFLTTMIENSSSGRVPTLRDATGAYFIDRNGRLFEPILDYLRYGTLSVPPTVRRADVLREMDFYVIAAPQHGAPVFSSFVEELRDLSSQCPARVHSGLQKFLDRTWPRVTEAMVAEAKLGMQELVIFVDMASDPGHLELSGVQHALTKEERQVMSSPRLLAQLCVYVERLHDGLETRIDAASSSSQSFYLTVAWFEDSAVSRRLAKAVGSSYRGAMHLKCKNV